jgi:hypothetical protein
MESVKYMESVTASLQHLISQPYPVPLGDFHSPILINVYL